MRRKLLYALSALLAGALVLVGIFTVGPGTSHAANHSLLAAQVAAPPVNIDNCPELTLGYRGGCVKQLQIELNGILGLSLSPDGLFGTDTYNAVVAYQAKRDLQQDGKVGPVTKQALDKDWSSIPTPNLASPQPAQAPSSPATQAPAIQAPATQAPASPIQAAVPAQQKCGNAVDTMNIVDPSIIGGSRDGSVNLSVNWCWDGSKITSTATPYVWTSKTLDGIFLEWNPGAPVTVDKNPQNGGFWTRETVVTGTYDICLPKYGCLPTQPFKMDFSVFGDGVTYQANRTNTTFRL